MGLPVGQYLVKIILTLNLDRRNRNINPLMPGVKKVKHTQTNLQLLAAGLFKNL